ncbi:MAG: copper chaperone CopZ [Peptococcaceae bacterium BRH_c4a]|nr:MAG: copper chaperone CopZ [Peptococcaceae bacterium BRH_c4a]
MAITEETLKVRGMSCNHCKMAVEKALKNLPGVSGAEVDLAAATVKVTYDPGSTDREKITGAIDRAGYAVVE